MYIAITFKLRSSINVRLTESSLYLIGFELKGPPKWGFVGRGEDVWWESTPILRIARYQT